MQESTREIHDELREKDRAREASIKNVRLLIRVCGDGIRALHRDERERVVKAIEDAREHLSNIRGELKDHPDLPTPTP